MERVCRKIRHYKDIWREFSLIYEFIVERFGHEHIFLILYVLNLIFSIIAYKLGFARKLPILKSVIVYISLMIGVVILTFFHVLGPILNMMVAPVTEVLIITSVVLAIYRIRLHLSRKAQNQK